MRKTALYLLFFNIILGRTAFADTYMPGYDTVPNVEDATGAGVSLGSTPYPPMYLPGGSINLDDVWTLNGGARMYWNSTRYPIQLNMAGQTWVDPALVPELFPQKISAPKKRYRPRRVAKAKPKPKLICFPADQVPEALRPKKTAVPVPVTPTKTESPKPEATKAEATPPVQTVRQESTTPPIKTATPSFEPPMEENTSVPAPRLQ